jgi:hypothetical protein
VSDPYKVMTVLIVMLSSKFLCNLIDMDSLVFNHGNAELLLDVFVLILAHAWM